MERCFPVRFIGSISIQLDPNPNCLLPKARLSEWLAGCMGFGGLYVVWACQMLADLGGARVRRPPGAWI